MAEPDVKAPGGKGTVKLFGAQMSKKTLMIAGLVGAGVLAYAYYSKRKSAAAGTATGGIDPQTGYPYGSAEDTAALAAQSTGTGIGGGYGGLDPLTGLPYGSIQDQQALQTAGYPVGGGGGSGVTTTPVTIAQWEQEAIANLEAGGVDQATISNAESGLPRYLAHLDMSQAQGTAVQLAVGLTGPPPSGGPYSIRIAPPVHVPGPPPPVHHPPPPPPGTPPVRIPAVSGERAEAALARVEAAGFEAHTSPLRNPAHEYVVTGTSPSGSAPRGSVVVLNVRIIR